MGRFSLGNKIPDENFLFITKLLGAQCAWKGNEREKKSI